MAGEGFGLMAEMATDAGQVSAGPSAHSSIAPGQHGGLQLTATAEPLPAAHASAYPPQPPARHAGTSAAQALPEGPPPMQFGLAAEMGPTATAPASPGSSPPPPPGSRPLQHPYRRPHHPAATSAAAAVPTSLPGPAYPPTLLSTRLDRNPLPPPAVASPPAASPLSPAPAAAFPGFAPAADAAAAAGLPASGYGLQAEQPLPPSMTAAPPSPLHALAGEARPPATAVAHAPLTLRGAQPHRRPPSPAAQLLRSSLRKRTVAVNAPTAAGAAASIVADKELSYFQFLKAHGSHEAAAQEGRVLHRFVRPSLLQMREKKGNNTLAAALKPQLTPDGLSMLEFPVLQGGQLASVPAPASFVLQLQMAKGVAAAGVEALRTPWKRVLRCCLLRGSQFLGNSLQLEQVCGSGSGTAATRLDWRLDAPLLVRAGSSAAELQLYVEFNASFELHLQDGPVVTFPSCNTPAHGQGPDEAVPRPERDCAQMVDELNTCWALINLEQAAPGPDGRAKTMAVPLHCGPLFDDGAGRKLLQDALDDMHTRRRTLRVLPEAKPHLSFAVHLASPAVLRKHGLHTAALERLPAHFVVDAEVARSAAPLVAYRQLMARALVQLPWPGAAISDPALAAFPSILADRLLLSYFLDRWETLAASARSGSSRRRSGRDATGPGSLTEAQTEKLFRRCVSEIWAAQSAVRLRGPHINNHKQWHRDRQREYDHFLYDCEDAPRSGTDGASWRRKQARNLATLLCHPDNFFRPVDAAESVVALG